MRGYVMCVLLALASIAAAASPEPPAQMLVKDTTGKVMEALRNERDAIRAKPERIFELVDEYIAPHFDLDRMSKIVLGRHWRDATPEQRQRFVAEFKTLLTKTYATALREYSSETVSYLPPRENDGRGDVEVRTELNLSNGSSIPIMYFLYESDGRWRVYDVKIEGVSLVINYRAEFNNLMRQNGLDGLIGLMEARNQGGASR